MSNISPSKPSFVFGYWRPWKENSNVIDSYLDYVKDNINSINNILEKSLDDPFQNELKIMELFPEFYNNYPYLVKKLCKKEDISMIYTMISKLNNIEKGYDTLKNVENKLGNELAEKYLYNKINK